jgi:hypothetical protein
VEGRQAAKKKFSHLKEAVLAGKQRLIQWLENLYDRLVERAQKEKKKLPDKTCRMTPWQVIKALA